MAEDSHDFLSTAFPQRQFPVETCCPLIRNEKYGLSEKQRILKHLQLIDLK
jgi:hypothetical protein